MVMSFDRVTALRSLRQELQEDAGKDFPQAVLTELLVLRDVCKKLDLNVFQCQDVLGESGWEYLKRYMDTPIGMPIDDNNLNRLGD